MSARKIQEWKGEEHTSGWAESGLGWLDHSLCQIPKRKENTNKKTEETCVLVQGAAWLMTKIIRHIPITVSLHKLLLHTATIFWLLKGLFLVSCYQKQCCDEYHCTWSSSFFCIYIVLLSDHKCNTYIHPDAKPCRKI